MKNQILSFQVNRNTNLMKSLSLAIMLIFIVPVLANAQAGKTNFSGTWALNSEKSELGQGGQRFGGGDMVVKQEANLLNVERTFTTGDGDSRSMASKYTLDGKEGTNDSGRGESKSKANWSADGKSLTIVTRSSFNGNERTSTEVWKLNDAKTLSIASKRQGRDGGEVKTTRVYDKK